LTTQMVVNAIKGVQGDYEGLGNGTHIGAVAKHFAGYGQVLGGSNFAAVEISERTLIDEIYPPFEAAVKVARTLGVMASHGDLNGIATHGNKALLTGILRELWNFLGYVVSDSNDIARLYYFMKVAENPEAAALMGLEAGIDVDLYAEDSYSYLPKMVKTNPEIEKLIDRSVRRVLRTKFILGLFDNPYIDIPTVEKGVRTASSLALAKEADLESIILLKNEDQTLPLAKNKSTRIALLGPLVKDNTQSMFESVAGPDIQFVTEKGFQLTDQTKGNPNLLDRDPAAIDKMIGLARQSVLKHRRTLAINVISEQADAILDTWDLSEFGDESTAKIIFGETSPSGKSPVTIPRSIGQLPFHYSMKEINYKKGYLFLEDGPIYPFGYGLSYTNFDYSDIKLSNEVITPNTELEVSVTIKNTGKKKLNWMPEKAKQFPLKLRQKCWNLQALI